MKRKRRRANLEKREPAEKLKPGEIEALRRGNLEKRKPGEKRTRREEKPVEERVWRKREPGKQGIRILGILENGEPGDGGTWIKGSSN